MLPMQADLFSLSLYPDQAFGVFEDSAVVLDAHLGIAEKCDDSRPQHHILRHAGCRDKTAFEPFVLTFMFHKRIATHTPFIKSICAALLSYTCILAGFCSGL